MFVWSTCVEATPVSVCPPTSSLQTARTTIVSWNRNILASAYHPCSPSKAYDDRFTYSQAAMIASYILGDKQPYLEGSKILDPVKFRDTLSKTSRHLAAAFEKKVKVKERKRARFISCINNLFKKIFSFICTKQSDSSTKISADFLKMIEDLSPSYKNKLKNQLSRITDEERYFIDYLIENIDYCNYDKIELITHILNGGFVSIDDAGVTFETWTSKMETKSRRISSHKSSDKQYAVRGPVVKELLFSKKQVSTNNGKVTEESWFQLERYPAKFHYHPAHLWTWVLYKVQKKNQGPFGSSCHTENSPIKLKLKTKAKSVNEPFTIN